MASQRLTVSRKVHNKSYETLCRLLLFIEFVQPVMAAPYCLFSLVTYYVRCVLLYTLRAVITFCAFC